MNEMEISLSAHVGTAALGCPVERSSTAHSDQVVILSEALFAERRIWGNHRAATRSFYLEKPRRNKREATFFTALALLFLTTLASAQTLTGTVKNATTNKPAAGDEVILLSLGQGMEESGRTKTDAKGNFSFKLDNPQAPHLIRAIHQDVTYHRMAPPGTTSVDVPVYDVGKKVDGISVVADIMRVQAEQGQLEVMRAFAVENKSNPPRTQMNERNLEFYLPEGSQIIESQAMTANGQPVNSAPVPVDDKKTRYAFLFPLRPGVTQFQVAYQLPYTGTANIDPKSIYPLQHFVAILPKSIQFGAAPGTTFQPMNDPQEPDANVQVASGAKAGDNLAFKISGEGTLQARQENAGASSAGDSAQGSSANDARPGGGLGPPIDAPDPLQKYRWYILGGFAAALVIGGVYVASRQQAANRALSSKNKTAALTVESDFDEIEIPDAHEPQPSSLRTEPAKIEPIRPASSSTALLDALKEELFQLEIEHKQGRISQAEYEKNKAALDLTLERALKREAAKSS
jgi:hypothetical protein